MTIASIASLSARLRGPCCSYSHSRATIRRFHPTKRTEACYSSPGDFFPFLPKKKENDDGDADADDEKGPTFVTLDPDSASLLPIPGGEEGYDSEGLFGPLALLAVGLEGDALRALANLLEVDLEARGVVPAFAATEVMLRLDLCSAFKEAIGRGKELCLFENSSEATKRAPRSSVVRPAVVLSGMSSPEVVSVVAAWRESGNAETHGEVLFCGAVPANWRGRTLSQLVEDIAGDAAEVEAREENKR